MSAWVNREQEQITEYLLVENQVPREKLGKGHILLDDDQRRRLAIKGKALGRKVLSSLTTIVTPDTILRWHRQLVAKKWDYSDRRKNSGGRPRIQSKIVELILKMAKKNCGWGYDRIQGALKNLGYQVSDETVGNVLKEHGIEPAPEREKKTTWETFGKSWAQLTSPALRSGHAGDWKLKWWRLSRIPRPDAPATTGACKLSARSFTSSAA